MGGQRPRGGACDSWSVLLPDAADGLLEDSTQAALDAHLAHCAGCSAELAEARRGAAWLGLLKEQTPEPPDALLAKILAQTSGEPLATPLADALPVLATAGPATALPISLPATHLSPWAQPEAETRSGWIRWQQRIAAWLGLDQSFAPMQPRLTMTTAMAFFSICLTLNLLGFSIRNVRGDVLRPAATLQRTAAVTGATVIRSVEGLRVVYRVQSRVNAWRTATAGSAEAPLASRP